MATKKISIGIIAASLALGACVTDPDTGQQRVSKAGGGAALGAGAGALLGGIIGGNTGALVGTGIGAIAGAGVGSYMDKQEKELRERTRGTGIEVKREGDDIALNLPSGISFDFNSAQVKPEFRPALDQVAQTLASYQSTYVAVAGHTDSVGSDSVNQRLSEQRATAVADYLAYQGVNRARLTTRGYGKNFPVAPNDTDAGRAQNRRVEIKLTPVTEGNGNARPGQPVGQQPPRPGQPM